MQKFLKAAMVPLLLAVISATAFASARLDQRIIPVRKYCTNPGGTNWVLLSGTAGFVDSTLFYMGANSMRDTSAAFSLRDWALAPTQPGNTVTAVDSLYGYELSVIPGPAVSGQATLASDSLYFTLQGSFDGVNWASGPSNVSLLKGTGSLSFQRMINSIWSVPHAAGTATLLSIMHYPLQRVIIQGSAVDAGFFQIMIRYWRDTNAISTGF